MSKATYIIILIIIVVTMRPQVIWSQSPERFSYQAVIRDADNKLIKDQVIGVQISIIPDSVSAIPVYCEQHTTTTNSNGLFTLEIGEGNTQLGDFSTINWGRGPFFLKTETDPEGYDNYTIVGTSQFLSVPYALHATTASNLSGPISEDDPKFSNSPASSISLSDINSWNSNTVNLTGNESPFNNWDKNVNDDFSGFYDDLQGKPTTLSAFTNDMLFLQTETDPAFMASPAAQISGSKVPVINALEGINTGDQDLSGLATKNELANSINSLRQEIPTTDNFLSVENDPNFQNSIAAAITSSDTARWNAASVGNYTEADPLFSAWDRSSGISITKSQITDLSTPGYEKELNENETSINIGFELSPNATIYINGTPLTTGQWSGVGTQMLSLGISIKQFDKLKVAL